MNIDIYKAKINPDPLERRYVFVRSGENIQTLPVELRETLGDLEFEKTIDMNPGEKRIALDTDEACINIQNLGYHVQKTRVEVRMSTG